MIEMILKPSGIRRARVPEGMAADPGFHEGLASAGYRAAVIDGIEVVGLCEGCHRPILDGVAHSCGEDGYLCAACMGVAAADPDWQPSIARPPEPPPDFRHRVSFALLHILRKAATEDGIPRRAA